MKLLEKGVPDAGLKMGEYEMFQTERFKLAYERLVSESRREECPYELQLTGEMALNL